jgi:Kef-type K+ transport system membrane component KefB
MLADAPMQLGTIALICAVALLGPALSLLTRGAAPVVVGELVAGIVIGRTGLRLVEPDAAELALLYDLGFVTLMLGVGMQVPLHDARLRGALRTGVAATAAAVPLALAAGYGIHALLGGPALVYAVVLVSSSAAVALPIIDEQRLRGPVIAAAIAWIALADVVATLAIPLAVDPHRAGHAALGTLAVAALVGLVLLVTEQLRRLAPVKRARKIGKRRGWAIDLRVALVALLALAYAAVQLGASLLVAGFGVGLVIAVVGGPKRLSREVLGLGQGFLVPVFFVLLGAKLDLRALDGEAIALAALLAGATVALHVLVSRLIRARPAVGLLASAQVGVPAAVIALGLPAGTLDQAQASAILCAALVAIGACAAGAAALRLPDCRRCGRRCSSPASTTRCSPTPGAPR